MNSLYGQCVNTDTDIWKDTWQSCQTTQSPNQNRGVGHWIMYDLGQVFRLSKTYIWNANEVGKTDVGFKNVVVDYSMDGSNWTELGKYEFSEGNGEAVYGGFEAFDFDGKNVRFVLITAIDNWGDSDCSGIAEVKFNISGVIDNNIITANEPEELALSFEIYPNPTVDECVINVIAHKPEKIDIIITDIMGKEVEEFKKKLKRGENSIELDLDELAPGVYFVTVYQESSGQSISKRLLLTED